MTDVALMTKDDYTKLMSKLTNLENLVMVLAKNTKAPTTVNVADVAQIEGISVTNLRAKKPWLMPNFGVSDYEGSKRWKYETLLKWQEIPESQRIEMYRKYKLNN